MNLTDKLQKIKCICSDVDGVLTDGNLFITTDGKVLRALSVYDGMGIKIAQKENLEIAVFTGGSAAGIKERLKSLDVKYIYTLLQDKKEAVEEFLWETEFAWDELLYIGDDIIDLEVMEAVGVAVAPPNAIDVVKQVADFITERSGGNGVLREVVERVLEARRNQ